MEGAHWRRAKSTVAPTEAMHRLNNFVLALNIRTVLSLARTSPHQAIRRPRVLAPSARPALPPDVVHLLWRRRPYRRRPCRPRPSNSPSASPRQSRIPHPSSSSSTSRASARHSACPASPLPPCSTAPGCAGRLAAVRVRRPDQQRLVVCLPLQAWRAASTAPAKAQS